MSLIGIPWFDLALLLPLAGMVIALIIRRPVATARWSLAALSLVLACAGAAAVAHFGGAPGPRLSPFRDFLLDDVSAPMAPVMVLLHLLALLGAAKSRLSLGFCLRLLASTFIALAVLGAISGWVLIGLLGAAALLPVWDMLGRRQPAQAYLVYMVPILAIMVFGWATFTGAASPWGLGLVTLGVVLYGGVFPLHGWLPTLFGNSGFGGAMLMVLPLLQIAVALKLIIPAAPADLLQIAADACLFTSVYAGGMAATQPKARRFLAYLCLSQSSTIMFAALTHTPASVAACLCLWISAAFSLTGLAFSIRGLEARFGRLSLREHHGFYEQAPSLAVCFLVAGLGCVGFPGLIGFVPMELLISGSVEQSLWITTALAAAAMLNGVAIMRAYFSLFTGKRPTTSIPLGVTRAERVGLIVIVLVVLLGGWFSPAVVASRHRAAEGLLVQRGDLPPEAPAVH